MARQFMLGDDRREILEILHRLHRQNIAFTVDVLGEAVVSEAEADQYAQRYLDLLELLGAAVPKWKEPCQSNQSPRGPLPSLNVSVKLSALYSQVQATDPETSTAKISERLRPILRRAKALQALVNFDMESYVLKDLRNRSASLLARLRSGSTGYHRLGKNKKAPYHRAPG